MFSVDQPITTAFSSDAGLDSFLQFFYQGTGAFSSSFVRAVGMVDTNFSRVEKWPNIQMTLMSITQPLPYESFLQIFNIHPETVRGMWKGTAGLNTFQIFLVNSRPLQRGEIRLASTIPEVPPLIDPKYLQNQEDVKTLIEGNSTSFNSGI